MITEFQNFLLEFNRKDIDLIRTEGISDNFTIAFELELECEDPDLQHLLGERDYITELRNKLYNTLKEEEVDFSEKIFFIEELTNSCDFSDDDETLKILNPKRYKDPTENIIVFYCSSIYEDMFDYINEQEVEKEKEKYEKQYVKYLTNKVKEYLPNMWKKYQRNLTCVSDVTLDKGIEVKQKTYIKGLDNAIKFLEIFFNDLDNQNYFKFTDKTGLHINIGFDKKRVKWNTVKGMFLLKDMKKKDIPFVYKDMISRMNTAFTDSIFNKLKVDRTKIDPHDIKGTENYLSKEINKIIKEFGSKHFAFNITKLKTQNYVEFRYVGGVIDKDLLINKMLYFCYIVYLMTTPDYKKDEYIKSLVKFSSEETLDPLMIPFRERIRKKD